MLENATDSNLNNELARFVSLFDKLVREGGQWIEKLDPSQYEWTPPSASGIHFGTRLRHASVKALYVHTAVAEHVWAKFLLECSQGDTIPLPRDQNFFHTIFDGDFEKNSLELHLKTLELMKGLTPETLRKEVVFAGDSSTWSVMGFLWGAWGHRSYHLGNLDMLIRIQTGDAPDFFSFAGGKMA